MKNRILSTMVALLVMTPSIAVADSPSTTYRLSRADQHAIQVEPITIVKSTAQIPVPVLLELDRLNHGKFVMAEPGQPFNATDVIMDRTLPGRRLILAAVDKDYCIVHYERGGIAHMFLIAVFKTAAGKAHIVDFDSSSGPIRDIAALKNAVCGPRTYDTEIMNL